MSLRVTIAARQATEVHTYLFSHFGDFEMSEETKADADQAVKDSAPESGKKKKPRRTHRLGVSMALKELTVPDGGLTSIPC